MWALSWCYSGRQKHPHMQRGGPAPEGAVLLLRQHTAETARALSHSVWGQTWALRPGGLRRRPYEHGGLWDGDVCGKPRLNSNSMQVLSPVSGQALG